MSEERGTRLLRGQRITRRTYLLPRYSFLLPRKLLLPPSSKTKNENPGIKNQGTKRKQWGFTTALLSYFLMIVLIMEKKSMSKIVLLVLRC